MTVDAGARAVPRLKTLRGIAAEFHTESRNLRELPGFQMRAQTQALDF